MVHFVTSICPLLVKNMAQWVCNLLWCMKYTEYIIYCNYFCTTLCSSVMLQYCIIKYIRPGLFYARGLVLSCPQGQIGLKQMMFEIKWTICVRALHFLYTWWYLLNLDHFNKKYRTYWMNRFRICTTNIKSIQNNKFLKNWTIVACQKNFKRIDWWGLFCIL